MGQYMAEFGFGGVDRLPGSGFGPDGFPLLPHEPRRVGDGGSSGSGGGVVGGSPLTVGSPAASGGAPDVKGAGVGAAVPGVPGLGQGVAPVGPPYGKAAAGGSIAQQQEANLLGNGPAGAGGRAQQ